MDLIIGIDDAGRGPVLGPMILAGVLADNKDGKELREMGAKDSKMLQPKKRKKIKDQIVSKFQYHSELSTPEEIDRSTNLNYLEAIKTAMIINKLSSGLKEKVRAVVDCPSTNIKKWTEDVANLLINPKMIDLVCEHKADVNNVVVSAASIVAKERREEEIAKIKKELGVNFGSGYPADPVTREFLKNNFKNPKYKSLIRFSWATVKNLISQEKQEKLF